MSIDFYNMVDGYDVNDEDFYATRMPNINEN